MEMGSWALHRPGPRHRKCQPEQACSLTDEKHAPHIAVALTDICHSGPTSTRLIGHLEKTERRCNRRQTICLWRGIFEYFERGMLIPLAIMAVSGVPKSTPPFGAW